MKILHIDTGKSWRGGQNQVRLLLRGLNSRMFSSYLALPVQAEHASRFEHCVKLPLNLSGFCQVSSAMILRRFCSEHQISLIHAHSSQAHNVAAWMKFFGCPLPLIVSRRVLFSGGRGIFSSLKYSSAIVNHFVTVSAEIRAKMLASGFESERISVIHSAVEPGEPPLPAHRAMAAQVLKQRYKINQNSVLIGFCGALTPEKGCQLLLKAFSLIAEEIPQSYLLIAGSGSEERQLRSYAVSCPCSDRIIFTGFLDEPESFLCGLDVLVFPSLSEGLGTTLLQAAWQCCPVIAADTGGIPELIRHGETGILFPCGDPVALAKALKEFLKDRSNESVLITGFLEHARHFFSPDHLTKAHADLYQHIVLSHR